MIFRLLRYRLKTEWATVCILVFLILLLLWFEMSYFNPSMVIVRNYDEFERLYGNEYLEKSRSRLAYNFGIENEELLGETPQEGFWALRKLYRGFCYIKLIMGWDKIIILLTNSLALLFLTNLFAKRRLGPLLTSGYSRGVVFSSLTLAYYCGVILLWSIPIPIMLRAYGISFSSDELRFFRITQQSWFLSTMTAATFSYLFAFLLQSTLLSFIASFGVYSLIAAIRPDWSIIPIKIMGGTQHKSWDPGENLSRLITGNWIAIIFILLAILGSWLYFRKRGLE